MSCIVVGFPSKIAALQFEWAWQNTHLTRHIPPDERITRMGTKTKYSPRTGRKITKITRPRMSLNDRLVNLHILLSAQSFRRWPLIVRFFAEDVYKAWQKVTLQRQPLPLSASDIICDIAPSKKPGDTIHVAGQAGDCENVDPKFGIQAMDFTYQPMKAQLQRSLATLAQDTLHCRCCDSELLQETELALVCPHVDCGAAFHLTCLGATLVPANEDTLLPKANACPGCGELILWSDIVKDLSLRSRGLKERTALFKEKRRKKGESVATTRVATDLVEALTEMSDLTELEEDTDAEQDEITLHPSANADPIVDAAEDTWHDLGSSPATKSKPRVKPKPTRKSPARRKGSPKAKRNSVTIASDSWSGAAEVA
ncbi:Structure-specific endonuclease subunit slx1 [Sphaceloma murrayae]|uniref:Structure-specific endonuclease subunit slx1 n=1 Tax=Sphaceloma murrayae TaxID=2082308 RepID=A0A2K1R1E4_9PEZI|nr:Structure-specific endonuclease subunit slx1 [Sphaceloma murrayae]